MEIEYKLKVFTKIAEALNREKIIWAVGGSLLLYFKKITTTFNDIDIMVSEKDIDRAGQLLSSYGTCIKGGPSNRYKTKHYIKYVIDDVEFDVISGFTIVSGGKEYYFPLEASDIKDSLLLNKTIIPLQSVNQWKNYYRLMDRTDKVQMIDESLNITK